jgi:plasmid stabilization system protein ParE
MAFRVEIALRAFNDLDEIADYITKNGSFDQAEKWFNGIVDAIRTLEDMPCRFPVADVSEELGQEVRLLLYGRRNRKYKVYYSIQQGTPSTGTVRVFHVRHWARKSLSIDEVRKLIDKAEDESDAGGDV